MIRYFKTKIKIPLLLKKSIFGGLTLVVVFLILMFPSISFCLGNIFFGKIPALYNVQLAQYFYNNASYPIPPINAPMYAHYQLSRTYFIQGKLNNALSEAGAELKIYPNNTRTYYVLGLTLGYMHREQEAIDAFSKFIEKYPDSWAARNDKAWLQFRIGDIDGALKTIEPLVEVTTWNVWVQNTYCALLINKKEYEKAKRACTYAKEAAEKMTEKEWGRSYPGNDPRIYGTGLNAIKTSINENLKLLEGK